MLVETARFWVDLGFFSERRDGRFVINGVTGPDEYTTVVDNNAFTNLMARENIEGAAGIVEWMRQGPAERTRAGRATRLAGRRSRTGAALPRACTCRDHEDLGIVLQDDTFLDREPGTSRACRPSTTRCSCTSIRWRSIATR